MESRKCVESREWVENREVSREQASEWRGGECVGE